MFIELDGAVASGASNLNYSSSDQLEGSLPDLVSMLKRGKRPRSQAMMHSWLE